MQAKSVRTQLYRMLVVPRMLGADTHDGAIVLCRAGRLSWIRSSSAQIGLVVIWALVLRVRASTDKLIRLNIGGKKVESV